jgi:multiple antibiotic resistance protein
MSKAARRAVAIKSVVVASIVLYVFAFLGQEIIKFFHVSVPALEIAGGLILLIFALGIVLGDGGHGPDTSEGGDIAIYPLAMPLLATPQAIVAIVVLSSRVTEAAHQMNIYLALGATLVIDLAVMVGAATLMKSGDGAKKSGGAGDVLLRVVAILLAALAVELILMGLREVGALPPLAGAAH